MTDRSPRPPGPPPQLASNARRLYGLNLCRGLGDKFLKDEDLGAGRCLLPPAAAGSWLPWLGGRRPHARPRAHPCLPPAPLARPPP